MRSLVSFLVFSFLCSSCSPDCEVGDQRPSKLCHSADAGAIAPNVPFVLEGTIFVEGVRCEVVVDGGLVDLRFSGGRCLAGTGSAFRAPGGAIKCSVPALAAGTYTVNSEPQVTFDVADAGIAACP